MSTKRYVHKYSPIYLGLIFIALLLPTIVPAGPKNDDKGFKLNDRMDGISDATFEKLLTKGQIVLVERGIGSRPDKVTGGVIIDISPIDAAKIIADFKSYPEWMPQVESLKVDKREGGNWETSYELSFAFSWISLGVDYTLLHRFDLPQKIDFNLIRGDMKEVRGGWNFYSIDGGAKTAVFYDCYTDLSSMGKLISFFLKGQPAMQLAIQASTAIVTVEALKNRAIELKSKGAIPTPEGWDLVAPKNQ